MLGVESISLCIFSFAAIMLIMWFKSICVDHHWLNYTETRLGGDGIIAWFCLMFGFKHVHTWIMLKIFKFESKFISK